MPPPNSAPRATPTRAENVRSLQVPRHIAIIMDGNGRWARQRMLPRHAGHRAGLKTVRMVVEQCTKHGVEVLTLFAFSSENWRRPKQEVGLLMELFMTALHREVRRLNSNDVRLRVIGDRSALPEKLQSRIAQVEALTEGNCGLVLQIAAHHGIERLVLGAWGAGVFGNDPAMVADAFRGLLAGAFAGSFREVVFAIHGGKGANHAAFAAAFPAE